MKRYLFLVAIFICGFIKAQTIIVRDNSTREVIPNAIIYDANNITVPTDNKGTADITPLDKAGFLTVYHPAYNSFTFTATETTSVIALNARAVVLDEVVFSANKFKEKKIDVPYMMEVIKQKDIEFGNQPTTGEVMLNTGAVFVQKSQMGGSSPVLRGFEASRVLMVVDGVRMNNAIYRAGHLQDIITMDANMLDRAEIIFGPSSTIYGSDALGGVMHFYTKNAELSKDDKMLVKVNTMARFASANTEKTGHLDFNLGWKKFASLTNITYTDFDDLLSGATKLPGYYKGWDRVYYQKRFGNRDSMVLNENDNLQVGTGYSQLDIMQRFLLKTGNFLSHNINFQMSQSSDVPRYDRLTDVQGGKLRQGEWNYGPQKRLLAAYTLGYSRNTVISDEIKVILAYQKIDQERITRRFQRTARTTQSEDVGVISANVDAAKKVNKHEIRYGLEITSNDVRSKADTLNIVAGTVGKAITRYADGGASMFTGAVYFSHSWEVNDNFVISDGIRFTQTNLKAEFIDTTFYKFPFKTAQQSNQAVTGCLGFTWKETDNYKVSLLFNSGFRAPNVDDLSKVFESAGNILIVPNADIKPEYTYNMEMSVSKVFNKRYKFDLTGFYSSLVNAMVLTDYKLNGSDSAMFNGAKTKVQAMQNANYGYVYGFTGGVQFDFNDNVSFKSTLTSTTGKYVDSKKDTVYALDHIPPVFGQTSLMYRNKNTDAEFFVRYNGKKSSADYSPSGEDNAVYSADPVKGYMPSWFTINIRAGYNITKNFRVNFACENITDNRYRVFASGINAPGRNFIVSLRYKM
ncbi:MAG: hypothetical protein K0S32_3695 [Bacteroidetes bacterium]|jgi:hemoglobin/transferrin/lactoferrin receptor protein|nr:hypothetical protein [Bacteroidota bacterium]